MLAGIALALAQATHAIESAQNFPDFTPPEGFMRLVVGPLKSNQSAHDLWCTKMVPRTLLDAPECSAWKTRNPFVMATRPFLMTGIGRTGTSFVVNALTRAGLDVNHDNRRDCSRTKECPGLDGAVSWPHAFSDQAFGTGTGERDCPRPHWAWPSAAVSFRVVVHLVREPLKTIDSRWNKVCEARRLA